MQMNKFKYNYKKYNLTNFDNPNPKYLTPIYPILFHKIKIIQNLRINNLIKLILIILIQYI